MPDKPLFWCSSSRKGTVISPIQVKELLAIVTISNYNTNIENLRHSVELIIGRTGLNFLVIYDHHWTSSKTFQKIKYTDAV